MTIKAAASAIIDDLVDSGSFLRTQVSACDFGILDGGGGCAVIVRPGISSMNYIGFGGVSEDTWGFLVHGYVNDTGNVVETMTRVLDMHDALKGAINGGSNANNSQYTTRVVSTNHNPDATWVSLGGREFLLVTANVTTREDP